MSTLEKFGLVVVGIVLTVTVIFSYHEFKEPPEQINGAGEVHHFDESLGKDFKIGPFVTVVEQQSSGGVEDNCAPLRPVIIAALHDISEHLEKQNIFELFAGGDDAFEVNEAALQLFCNKNAEILLADTHGNKLLLQKAPFSREVPPEGAPADIGTRVRINATVIPAGATPPTQPTTFGDVLIPDRFLDAAPSSNN